LSSEKISEIYEMTEKTGHILLYDGDCPFCRSIVNRWRGTLEGRGFEIIPLQTEWVRRRLDLPKEELLSEMRVLTPDGRVIGGAAALVHVWSKIWWAWPLWLAAQVPGAKWLLGRAYRWVAERRMCLSGTCSLHAHPTSKRGLGIIGWLPLLTLPTMAVAFRPEFPERWMFMWVLAFAIFMSFKWLTFVRAWSEGGLGGIVRLRRQRVSHHLLFQARLPCADGHVPLSNRRLRLLRVCACNKFKLNLKRKDTT